MIAATVRLGLVGGLLALSALSVVPVVQAATDEERAAARNLAEQGAKAFSEERFADALDLFTRAEDVVHSPAHLLYMARANAQLGRLVKAQEAYIKITREEIAGDAPDAFKRAAADAATELEALKPRIPRLTVKVTGAGDASAEVLVDDEPIAAVLVGVPVPVDPGKRKVQARADGFEPAQQEVAIGEGQSAEVELQLVPAAASPDVVEPTTPTEPVVVSSSGDPTLRYAAYGALGVGALGVGLGTYFTIDGADKSSQADDRFASCGQACEDEVRGLDDDAASAQTNAVISYAVGGVAIGAGVVLWILSAEDDQPATGARITPWVGFNSAGVSGTF